mmetsp:Transcript_4667/g.18685  ORF Transcript_4667/g.18685 Transcript_4667/m.18685 type:complete len:268 (-) Transcript_4667:1168-1971(-)
MPETGQSCRHVTAARSSMPTSAVFGEQAMTLPLASQKLSVPSRWPVMSSLLATTAAATDGCGVSAPPVTGHAPPLGSSGQGRPWNSPASASASTLSPHPPCVPSQWHIASAVTGDASAGSSGTGISGSTAAAACSEPSLSVSSSRKAATASRCPGVRGSSTGSKAGFASGRAVVGPSSCTCSCPPSVSVMMLDTAAQAGRPPGPGPGSETTSKSLTCPNHTSLWGGGSAGGRRVRTGAGEAGGLGLPLAALATAGGGGLAQPPSAAT